MYQKKKTKYSFGNTGLLEAVKNNEIAEVRSLLAAGADVNFVGPEGWTSLHWAAWYANIEMVELLVDAGANVDAVNADGETPLYLAVDNGYTETVELLVDAGANVDAVDADGWTSLHLAAWYANIEMVELLVDAGANVDAVNADGETPLYIAVDNGYTETVKLLVDAGANVNSATTDRQTPLHEASERGAIKTVKLLVDAGANVNAVSIHGRTPLHEASRKGHTEIVKLLVAKGANVNAVSIHGRTPLHFASWEGYTEIVKLLVAKGAKISVRDTERRTALDLARERGHTEIADAIIAEDMIRLENRNKAGRIEKGRGIPAGLISQYLAFGRTKGRATIKRPVSKKKSMANKTSLAKIKKTAQKLGIRVTTTRNGKRVYKKVPALLIMKREKIVKIVKSPSTGKKYTAIVQNLVTKKTRKIHFGATGYQHYKDSTSIKLYRSKNHYDKNRRRRYFLRHSGVSGKRQALSKEWKKSKGLFNPKILSHYYLW